MDGNAGPLMQPVPSMGMTSVHLGEESALVLSVVGNEGLRFFEPPKEFEDEDAA